MIYRFSETESPCAGRAVNPALQYEYLYNYAMYIMIILMNIWDGCYEIIIIMNTIHVLCIS